MAMFDLCLEITTQFGSIIAEKNDDSDYPAIWITLETYEGIMVPLATIECTENKTDKAKLQTVVFGKERADNPTHVIIHELMPGDERNAYYGT